MIMLRSYSNILKEFDRREKASFYSFSSSLRSLLKKKMETRSKKGTLDSLDSRMVL
jgi:hypothetical protein